VEWEREKEDYGKKLVFWPTGDCLQLSAGPKQEFIA